MHRPDYLKSSYIGTALSLSVCGPGILYCAIDFQKIHKTFQALYSYDIRLNHLVAPRNLYFFIYLILCILSLSEVCGLKRQVMNLPTLEHSVTNFIVSPCIFQFNNG